MWSRIYLVPLLQAEEDRDQVRRYWADKERERVLLGTDTKIYNSDRYVERIQDMSSFVIVVGGLVLHYPAYSKKMGLNTLHC